MGDEAGGNGDAGQLNLHLAVIVGNALKIQKESPSWYLTSGPDAFKPDRFAAQVRLNS